MPRNPGRTPARKPKVKGGHSAAASAERRRLFVERYLVNGHNAAAAAIRAGFSPRSKNKTDCLLLREPVIKARVAERARAVSEAAEMTTDNWARELRAVAFSHLADCSTPMASSCPLPRCRRTPPLHSRRSKQRAVTRP